MFKSGLTLGILQCDSVLEQFQDQFSDYPDMFIHLFQSIMPDLEFAVYDVQNGHYPDNINECHAYISTGSRVSVYDDLDWLTPFKDFIRLLYQNKTKLVAICFAHQLVAEVYAGKAEKSERGWGVGVATDPVFKTMPWMTPPLEKLNLIVSHQDQVTRLPKDAILLAGNDFCPNFMYQIDEHILSIQGHPEFTKQYSQTLMEHRAVKIGEHTYQKALESLKLETNEKIVAHWILKFLGF